MGFAPIEKAVEAISKGEIVIVVDGEDRENEGDLIMAAEAATPEKVAFFLAHTSGVVCTPLTPERLDELEIPLMVSSNTESQTDGVHGQCRRKDRYYDGHIRNGSRRDGPARSSIHGPGQRT